MKCTKKEFAELLIGVFLIGMGGGIFRWTEFGADPYTTMNVGISNVLPISYGTWQLMLNIILMIPMIAFARKQIGWGTIINMVGVGYSSDFVLSLLSGIPNDSFVARVIMMFVGLVIVCLGVAIYIYPDKGAGPYDALQLIAMDWSHGKISYQTARITCDVTCVIIGVAFTICSGRDLWKVVGMGTILTACFTGVIVQWYTKWFKKTGILDEKKTDTAVAA